MTREEAIKNLELSLGTYEALEIGEEELKMAIEALKETERNPTVTSWHDFDRGYNIAKEKFARPHGEWICEGAMADYTNVLVYRCSICEEHFTGHEEDKKTWHFCPNCGASMSANDKQVTGKLNSEIEKLKSEIVPDYRDGWRLKEGETE